MSRDAVRAHREAMGRIGERHREAVALNAAADAQWWRPVRNRWRRTAARVLLGACEEDFAAAGDAWDAMSPSEQARETRSALRGAAIQPSSLPSSGGNSA